VINLFSDLLISIVIVTFVTSCGLGIFRLSGIQHFSYRLLLAPSLAIAVSGILVALVVIDGIPIGKASPFLWLLWVFLSLVGVTSFKSAWVSLDYRHIIYISGLATIIVTAGYFRFGLFDYLGSPALDGWSYVSFGEYLRQYPKGTEGGLAPIYQYASHLSATRFIASGLLAAFIPPLGNGFDTQMMVGPLLILSLTSYALSIGYATIVINQRGMKVPVWLSVCIGVLGGWVHLALIANNYDNLLVLSISPALFGLALDLNLNKKNQIILPTILIAASFYIYPELFPFIIFAYFCGWIGNFFQYDQVEKKLINRRYQILNLGFIALSSLIIVSPYLFEAIGFFYQQLASTSQTSGRPGEGLVPSLVDGSYVIGALWGLGGSGVSMIIGILLGLVALFGIAKALIYKNIAIVIYIFIIIFLFSVMIIVKNYDYGAYKIILMGWWAVSIALSAGALVIWETAFIENLLINKIMRFTLVILLSICTILWIGYAYKKIYENKHKFARHSREARDAIIVTNNEVQISVSDTTNNAWLVYQLRDAKALFAEFHGYMNQAHVQPLMARSMMPSQDKINYILTDVNSYANGELVWNNNIFKLIKGDPAEQPPRLEIKAPNGQEEIDGKPFFWIGKQQASINLKSINSKIIQIEFQAFTGPDINNSIKLMIINSNKIKYEFDISKPNNYNIEVNVEPGENIIEFQTPNIDYDIKHSNGDARELIMGLRVINLIVK